ncbi:hypothetical protein BGZ94_003477 [Podila epigama]|nr:hypothetical protein BGZ94_003477 [Podila epigama]
MFLDKLKKSFDLSVVKNIELNDMAIDFTLPDPWTSTIASNHLIARLTAIPGFSWPIQQVQLKIVVQDNGIDIGHFESPFSPAHVTGGIVTMALTPSTMNIFPDARHESFAHFVAALATKSSHTFSIKGSADILFDLGKLIGIHTLHGVDFVSDLTLRGLANLPDITCKSATIIPKTESSLTEPHQDSLVYAVTIQCVFDIPNPSQLNLTLGDCTLATSVEGGHHVGLMRLDNFTLLVGMNENRTGLLTLDTTIDAAKSLLNALELSDQKVQLKGFRNTSKNEALSAGLAALSTSFIIPRLKPPSS